MKYKKMLGYTSAFALAAIVLTKTFSAFGSSNIFDFGSNEEKTVKDRSYYSNNIDYSELVEIDEYDYCYRQLDKEARATYCEIYYTLLNREEDTPLTTTYESVVEKAYNCVMNDHPEIFWTNGFEIKKLLNDDEIIMITFSGTYTMDEKEIEDYQQRIDAWTEECLTGVPITTDDYKKIEYIYDYVIEHASYDEGSEWNQTIVSVMTDSRSVCNGYAKTVQYLLNKIGIQCILVNGTASGGLHTWNMVKSNGEWYHMDATWGDTGLSEDSIARHIYFMCTTADIKHTHVINNPVGVPDADSIEDNWYYRQGLYLTEYNEITIARILDEHSFDTSVSIKFADASIWKTAKTRLITLQRIFLLTPETVPTLQYDYDDQSYVIAFYF